MKKLLTLLPALAFGILLFSQGGPTITNKQIPTTNQISTNPNAPVFNFDSETHDFGQIPEGPKVTTDFNFTNSGLEPLIISKVKASCGCTVPTWPKEPILPGQSSSIKVTYNTERRVGPFTKAITITSNAKNSRKIINIKGKVNKAPTEQTMPVKPQNMMAPN